MDEQGNKERLSFQQVQYAFAAHLRNPQENPPPDNIESRRMQVYRDLFYNTVEGLIARAFPIVRELTPDPAWHARVRRFYARHYCQTPLFHEVAEEFLDFLEHDLSTAGEDPPFLLELAHYEWVETALIVDEAELSPELADPNGDPMQAPPVVSPLAWPLAYEWPVHRIGKDYQPQATPENPTYLVVYRSRQFKVHFLEINAVTARLLQLIEEAPERTGTEHMQQIAAELSHPDPQQVIEQGRHMLVELRESDLLLGTLRRN